MIILNNHHRLNDMPNNGNKHDYQKKQTIKKASAISRHFQLLYIYITFKMHILTRNTFDKNQGKL